MVEWAAAADHPSVAPPIPEEEALRWGRRPEQVRSDPAQMLGLPL